MDVLFLLAVVGLYFTVNYLLACAALLMPFSMKPGKFKRLPKVSIIIAAMNEETIIENTLKNLRRVDYPDYETIVVCQGNDNTAKIAGKYARVIHDKKTGKWHALQLGVKAAKGEIIYFLDADTLPDKDSIKKIVSYMGKYEVSTGVTIPEGSTPTAMVFRLEGAFNNSLQLILSCFLGTGFVQGKNYAIYKKTLKRVGGFKKAPLEDINLTFRLFAKKIKVAVVDAKCREQATPKLGWYIKQHKRWELGKYKEFGWLSKHNKVGIFTKLFAIPSGLAIYHTPMFSFLLLITYLYTGGVFLLCGSALGLAVQIITAARFLRPADLLAIPLTFTALAVSQAYFILYMLSMRLTGVNELWGRTDKAAKN
ncbi:MAG: glycosyltransferase family 2 protein [Candidatus Aenigmarchaeota archaeon]|nr:glycosyltransferase family 2 protein [Candidatus Aenigmarchaeota archaeon]